MYTINWTSKANVVKLDSYMEAHKKLTMEEAQAAIVKEMEKEEAEKGRLANLRNKLFQQKIDAGVELLAPEAIVELVHKEYLRILPSWKDKTIEKADKATYSNPLMIRLSWAWKKAGWKYGACYANKKTIDTLLASV